MMPVDAPPPAALRRREVYNTQQHQQHQQHQQNLHIKGSPSGGRVRRRFCELDHPFPCTYPFCSKSYTSKAARNLHFKLKHDNGRKPPLKAGRIKAGLHPARPMRAAAAAAEAHLAMMHGKETHAPQSSSSESESDVLSRDWPDISPPRPPFSAELELELRSGSGRSSPPGLTLDSEDDAVNEDWDLVRCLTELKYARS